MFKALHFEIELAKEAEEQYNAFDDSVARRINIALDHLTENPFFGPNIVKLEGNLKGQYRYRVGSYRIVYTVNEKDRTILVNGIPQRGRAYR